MDTTYKIIYDARSRSSASSSSRKYTRKKSVPPAFISPPLLEPGHVVGSRYVLTEFVNEGGMGEIWLARDWFNEIKNKIAIKIALASSPEYDYEEILRAEASLLRKLAGTEGVVKYIGDREGDREKDGFFYLAMEFIQGKSIAENAHGEGYASLNQAVQWGYKIAEILDRIHTMRILHGDLSIENVMIARGGQVKLIDFGIAAAYQTGQIGNNVLANVYYMAPELFQTRHISPLTDIYAFGVTIYKMVTGEFPFSGSVSEIKHGHLARPVPTHPRLEPLRAMVNKCMAKNPDDRYQSALQIRDDLSSFQPFSSF